MQLNCAESSCETLSRDGIETFTLKDCLRLLKNEQEEQFKRNEQMLCSDHPCETIRRDEVETLTLRGVLKGYGYQMICSKPSCKDEMKALTLRGLGDFFEDFPWRPVFTGPRLFLLLEQTNRQLEFEEKKMQALLNQQKKSIQNQSHQYKKNRHEQKQLSLQDKMLFKKNKKLPRSQQRMQIAHRTR